MDELKSGNLALRFLLELAAVVAAAYWGFTVEQGLALRLILGFGAPLLVIIIWAFFVAPRAPVALPRIAKFVLGLLVLELAAAALFAAGHHSGAVIFGIVAALNALLLLLWDQ
jgi:uncharacterized protein DUF2568